MLCIQKPLVPKLSLRQLGKGDANKCMSLQMNLDKSELRFYGKRNLADYETMINSGVMLGHYNKDEELVSQIGTTLNPKHITSGSGYIASSNTTMQILLEESAVIEQGSYITRPDYRGLGLMSNLELELADNVVNLYKNGELKNKNKELSDILLDDKSLIIVSGCSGENPASALTSMKNGSEIIGVVNNIKVNDYELIKDSYTLAKTIINNNSDDVFCDEDESTEIEIKNLLKGRKKLEKDAKNSGQEKVNPIPATWVKVVTDKGYLISKKSEKYNLRKPIIG